MAISTRLTSADLEVFPDDGKRYEIIDGELYVTRQPSFGHQTVCTNLSFYLTGWSNKSGLGRAIEAPGVVFADDDDVAPDTVWATWDRLREILRDDGHLHGPPQLVIEVLSPGSLNERRDREVKLKLYSRRAVDEYWIVDWHARVVDIYRQQGGALTLVETMTVGQIIVSPLLPGFALPLEELFAGITL